MLDQSLQRMNDLMFSYDNSHDILYLYIGKPTISYDEEKAPGIFLRLSEENDSITGIIIMDYKKKDQLSIKANLPLNIDFNKINSLIH